jgi:hypothetical protein
MENSTLQDWAIELAFHIVEHDSDKVGDPTILSEIIFKKLKELAKDE